MTQDRIKTLEALLAETESALDKAAIASVGIDGLKATSMFGGQPAHPVAVKVQPLEWSQPNKFGASMAYDPLLERQAVSMDPERYDKQRSEYIIYALNVQPITAQDAARVLLDWWHQPEPDPSAMVIEDKRVMGVLSALSEHGDNGFEVFTAALRAIAEGRA